MSCGRITIRDVDSSNQQAQHGDAAYIALTGGIPTWLANVVRM
jgi:hypothetical protein